MKSPFFASKRSSFLSRRTALPVWSWYPSLGCYWVISSRSWRWSCRAYPNGLCRLEGKHCWNQPDIWDFDGIYVVRAGFLWFFCRIRVGSVCDIYKPKSRLFGDSGIYMEIVSPNPIFSVIYTCDFCRVYTPKSICWMMDLTHEDLQVGEMGVSWGYEPTIMCCIIGLNINQLL